MHKKSLLLALLLVLSLVLTVGGVAQADDSSYTVKKGDTLTSIAAQNNVTVSAIAQLNGIANVNNIFVGQVLKLPGSGAPATAPAPTTGEQAYIVVPGDTLTGIAARFGVTVGALAEANNISVVSYVYVGQNLKIPGATKEAPKPTPVATTAAPAPTATPVPPTATPKPAGKTTEYTVESGDTLSSIANSFGVSVDAIVEANNLSNPNSLSVGQKLTIPGANGTAPKPKTQAPAQQLPADSSNPASTGKWIDVNLSQQRLVAYEGSKAVYSSLVSTGVSYYPTPTGTFNIGTRYTAQAMSGPGYYLPNVPYVMYFYEAYAIHGTYWHNNFGTPMSHGCVNLPTPGAKWVYSWAPAGTPVKIHY